jgi:HK97 family phage major capsid protein
MPKPNTVPELFDTLTASLEQHTASVAKIRDETRDMLEKAEQSIDSLIANGTFARRGHAGGVNAVVDQFMHSEQFAAFRRGATSTGQVQLAGSLRQILAAASPITSDTGGYETAPGWSPRLGGIALRKLELLRGLPHLPVEAGSMIYNQIPATYTNAATEQLGQGAAKAEADIEPASVTAAIPTIAHWVPLSTQVVMDSPTLTPVLSNLLAYGAAQRLENQLVNGAGGSSNSIKGLLAWATAYAATVAFSPMDRIGQAITEVDNIGYSPSLVCVNPLDWFAMQSAKSAGSGEYLLGSPGVATARSLWGVPVALVPSLAAGTALVLDSTQLAVLDRQQPTVLLGRQNDDFTRNKVTALGELRAGLMALSPASILSVSLV